MNKSIEEEIVRYYIKENKQERILWELNSPKKRKDIIWKFAGTDLFKMQHMKATRFLSATSLKEHLFQISKNQTVYFLGEDYIGQLSITQAVQRALQGEVCIIYCGQGYGYYQGEQVSGSPPRYFLVAE